MRKYKNLELQQNQLINEPFATYGQANYFEMATKEIPKNYIKNLLRITKLSLEEFIAVIPISLDTYKRKVSFGSHVTEKVLEIEEVYKEGIDAFGDHFHEWMNTKNVALGNIKPKSLLVNSFGIRRLYDQIGRIKYGVLA